MNIETAVGIMNNVLPFVVLIFLIPVGLGFIMKYIKIVTRDAPARPKRPTWTDLHTLERTVQNLRADLEVLRSRTDDAREYGRETRRLHIEMDEKMGDEHEALWIAVRALEERAGKGLRARFVRAVTRS